MFQTDKILKYRMSRYCLKVIANGTGSPYGIVMRKGLELVVKSIKIALLINLKPARVYLIWDDVINTMAYVRSVKRLGGRGWKDDAVTAYYIIVHKAKDHMQSERDIPYSRGP